MLVAAKTFSPVPELNNLGVIDMGIKKGDIIKVSLKERPMFQALEDTASFTEGVTYHLVVKCIRGG